MGMSVERALEIIGVSRGVGDKELGRAYRQVAYDAHPDRNGGDEEPFKAVSEAHAVLKAEVKSGWPQPFDPQDWSSTDPRSVGSDVGPPSVQRMQNVVELYMRCFFGGLDPEIDEMAANFQRRTEEELKNRGKK